MQKVDEDKFSAQHQIHDNVYYCNIAKWREMLSYTPKWITLVNANCKPEKITPVSLVDGQMRMYQLYTISSNPI